MGKRLLIAVCAAGCMAPPPVTRRRIVPRDRTCTLAVRAEPGTRLYVARLGVGGMPVAPRFEGVAPASGVWLGVAWPRGDYRVVASAMGRARVVRDLVLWQGVTDVALALDPEAPLSGRVLVGDAPVSGATVTVEQDREPIEARSRPDGRFVLAGLRPGPTTVRVRASGFAPAEREALAPGDGIDVALRRLLRLEGNVLASGAPVRGTEVRVGGSGLWPPRAVEADLRGHYAVDLVAGVYALSADAPGLASAPVEGIELEASGLVQNLALLPAAPLVGTVRAAGGAPVAGAVVTLGGAELSTLGRRAVTDASGAYSLGPLPPGWYRVHASAAGFLPAAADPVELRPPATARLDVTLSPGAVVTGQVVDAAGAGIAGARILITIVGPDGVPLVHAAETAEGPARFLVARGELGVTHGPIPMPSEATAAGRAFVTGEGGRFRVGGLPAGSATVRAAHAGFADAESAALALRVGEVSDVRLELQRGAEIAGRILDADGVPLPQALVRATKGAGVLRTALSDAKGDYLLSGLVGRVVVDAELDGYLKASRALDLGEDARVDRVDLTLDPASLKVDGRVLDEGGVAVARAMVELVPARGERRKTRTDKRGLFSMKGLGPGPTELVVSHPDFPPLRTSFFPEQQQTLDLVVPFGGGIEGFVRDARTLEAAAAFSASCGGVVASGAGGEFTIRPVPAGACTLEVLVPGYAPWRSEVDVPSGGAPGEVTLRDVLVEVDLE
jgi:carboxypeptidase family protein